MDLGASGLLGFQMLLQEQPVLLGGVLEAGKSSTAEAGKQEPSGKKLIKLC